MHTSIQVDEWGQAFQIRFKVTDIKTKVIAVNDFFTLMHLLEACVYTWSETVCIFSSFIFVINIY